MSDLHFTHWPVETPKAVMALVHGFGEHAGRYVDMAAELNKKDIAVLAVDLPGHGLTEGPRGVMRDYEEMRESVARLLAEARARHPDVPLVLYGHSMGGGAVLDHGFSPAPEVRAIIASAPLIALPKPVPGAVRGVAKVVGRVKPDGTMRQPIAPEKISTLPEEQARYANDPLNHDRLGFRLAEGMIAAGEAIAARAAQWDMPLLLMHARNDELTAFSGSAGFAALARQVEFYAFDDVAHEMHNDTTRAEIYGLMTDFILHHASPAT